MNMSHNAARRITPRIKAAQLWVAGTLLIALLGVLVLGLVTALQLALPTQIDYGEAPLLEQAQRLRAGEMLSDLYAVPSGYPYRTINYPPAYFWLASVATHDGANPYAAGRWISTLSMASAAACIGVLAWRWSGSKLAGAAAPLVWLVFPAVTQWGSLMRIDMLALALSLLGLTMAALRPSSLRVHMLAAVLLVAAALTRQTYVVCAPLAVLALIWRHNGFRPAVVFAAMFAGLLGLAYIGLNVHSAGGYAYHIGGVYAGTLQGNSADQTTKAIEPMALLALLALLGMYMLPSAITGAVGRARATDCDIVPLLAYAAGGAVAIAAYVLKPGANINYLIESNVAVSIMLGLTLAHAHSMPSATKAALLAGPIAFQTLLFGLMNLGYANQVETRHADQTERDRLMQVVRDARGNVIADEHLGLLVEQGFPIQFQPFDFSQMARQGLWDQRGFVNDLQAGRFDAIIIARAEPEIVKQRWTPEMLSAIETRYRLMRDVACCDVYVRAGP
jgi:hypothetical protein